MSDCLRLATIACCVVGLAIAGYLTYVHYAAVAPVCAISHGCEQVQTSRWSTVAGVPVALLGLLAYAAILAVLLAPGEVPLVVAAAGAVTGTAFSLYLTYREVFTIEAICIWCVASAALMATLAVLTVVRMLRAEPGALARPRSPQGVSG